MPLLVTRRPFAVAVALLVLASAGALGARPSGQHPTATRAVAPDANSSRRPLPLRQEEVRFHGHAIECHDLDHARSG